MNLKDYLKAEELRRGSIPEGRKTCYRCRMPEVTCYCALIKPFPSPYQIVILIHREEVYKKIATGRMAHLCLSNSRLIEGLDFSQNEEVNQIIEDKNNFAILLFPGKEAKEMESEFAKTISPFPERRVVIFVIDGTWAQAKRMRRLSSNLNTLPTFTFKPNFPSRFLVRKQPRVNCYSTIESIHYVLDTINPERKIAHHNLLEVFATMVNRQVECEREYGVERGFRSDRGLRVARQRKPR